MSEPKRYDMSKPEDVERWFHEMEGYLRVDNFIANGTDFDGRTYALQGFRDLKKILCGGK